MVNFIQHFAVFPYFLSILVIVNRRVFKNVHKTPEVLNLQVLVRHSAQGTGHNPISLTFLRTMLASEFSSIVQTLCNHIENINVFIAHSRVYTYSAFSKWYKPYMDVILDVLPTRIELIDNKIVTVRTQSFKINVHGHF